ncbi:hypothetical protein HY68_12920 [Streptomyces sp. AcH 505]|uniref:DUF4232 domain-containing protein n=1 Tax=unclassified Streptomyces TaxID=2593676 RepID=UPI000591E7B4|nr:DUF4232 domain-containing protein [Streptomyces sp. NBC_00370]KIF69290.1 hypothetical protein HY68_12920 [Streptomyces sp. AcH 505]
MRVHKLTFAALAVVAGLSLTACQSDDDSAGQSAPSSAASNTPSADSGSGSDSSDQGGGSDAAGNDSGASGSNASSKVGKCRTDDLEITATDNTIDGDTDATVAVELKNGSGRDCVISGYAGVDLKTNAGSLSAKRTGQETTSAVLKDGKSTAFPISYPFNKSGGSGIRITGLVVTPPDETKSVTLDWPGEAALPVTEGAGSPVRIGPVGSAGQGG